MMGIGGSYPQTVAAAGSNLPRCAVRYYAGAAMGSGTAGAQAMATACANVPGTQGIRYCGSGELWAGAFPDYLVWQSYNHFGTPNQVNCTNAADTTDHNSPWAGYYVTAMGSAPPSSQHPGGVNVAFSDGSVHFIKNTVGLQPWWALGSRAGGEVISSDQY
jgi:prepilin-type processing-associated H-X9-DG protein